MPFPHVSRPWLRVAFLMFAIGWGANMFAPLLLLYRERQHMSDTIGSAIFGVYALTLIPALLIGGAISDRIGRRSIVRIAAIASATASLLLIGGADNEPLLFIGRGFAGIASGLAFGAGTAWVKELSTDALGNTGARRAAIAMSAGFGLGGLFGGIIAQWAPAPGVTPYVVHLVMIVVATLQVWQAPEGDRIRVRISSVDTAPRPGMLATISANPRFLRVIVVSAPWVFGTATISFTILPRLVTDATGNHALIFAGVITGLTQLTGVAIQPWAQRQERMGRQDLLAWSMMIASIAFVLAIVIAATGNPWLALVTSVIFGTAYGILLVSGLAEISRLAHPHDLGTFVSIFYMLTYAGFAMPYILAAIAPWIDYPVSFGVCLLLTVVSAFWLKKQLVSHDDAPGTAHPAR